MPAKLVGKMAQEWVSIEVEDDGKKEAAKIGWKAAVEMELEGEGKSKK